MVFSVNSGLFPVVLDLRIARCENQFTSTEILEALQMLARHPTVVILANSFSFRYLALQFGLILAES